MCACVRARAGRVILRRAGGPTQACMRPSRVQRLVPPGAAWLWVPVVPCCAPAVVQQVSCMRARCARCLCLQEPRSCGGKEAGAAAAAAGGGPGARWQRDTVSLRGRGGCPPAAAPCSSRSRRAGALLSSVEAAGCGALAPRMCFLARSPLARRSSYYPPFTYPIQRVHEVMFEVQAATASS
jgi:hypothetical protein